MGSNLLNILDVLLGVNRMLCNNSDNIDCESWNEILHLFLPVGLVLNHRLGQDVVVLLKLG